MGLWNPWWITIFLATFDKVSSDSSETASSSEARKTKLHDFAGSRTNVARCFKRSFPFLPLPLGQVWNRIQTSLKIMGYHCVNRYFFLKNLWGRARSSTNVNKKKCHCALHLLKWPYKAAICSFPQFRGYHEIKYSISQISWYLNIMNIARSTWTGLMMHVAYNGGQS